MDTKRNSNNSNVYIKMNAEKNAENLDSIKSQLTGTNVSQSTPDIKIF